MSHESDQADRLEPRFIFVVCDGLRMPVVQSQVIRVIEQLAEQGRRFDLLLYGNIFTGLLSHRENKKRLAELRSALSGKIRFFYLLTFGEISVEYGRYRLRRWLKEDLRRGRPIIFHCRLEYSTHILAPLRREFPNVRIINDVRGEIISEYDNRSRGRKSGALMSYWRSRKRRKFYNWQKEAAQVSDEIICVSRPLADYYIDNCAADPKKIQVLRTGADEERFFYEEAVRLETRRHLGIEDRRVFIYSGSLVSYQMIDQTLQLFRIFKELDSNSFLILLTPEANAAREKVQSAGFHPSDYLIRSVPVSEVPRYLMAADIGFLLRESTSTNYYASPVKVGEYWLCGLPVLSTSGAGDFAHHLQNYPVGGSLIDIQRPDTWKTFCKNVLEKFADSQHRTIIQEAGRQIYSRKSFLKAYLQILDKLAAELIAP